MAVHTVRIAGEEWVLEEDGELLRSLGRRWPRFFQTARWCENVRREQVGHGHELLGDPMEVALVEMAQKALAGEGTEERGAIRLDEAPFNSRRKRLSVLYSLDGEEVVYTKGAMETVILLCTEELVEGGVRPLAPERKLELMAEEEMLAARGLRVLGLAGRKLQRGEREDSWEERMVFLGMVGLEDPPRRDVSQCIDFCRQAGVRVIMMTGDHPTTAQAIADRIGLSPDRTPQVLTGRDLDALSDAQLRLALDGDLHFARLDPGQKVRIFAALQQKGAVVAVTGDGINDLHCRHESSSSLTYGMGGNRLLWVGLAFLGGVVLTIIFAPPVQRLFSTLAPEPWLWLMLIPMAVVFWGVEELRKLWVRKRARNEKAPAR